MFIKLTPSDKFYPTLLKYIHDPPKKLYVQGSVESLNNFCVAVVGTRRPSLYGKAQAEEIADFLAKNGATIVSGFARGIDMIAHEAAIKNNTPTIAVLGSGFGNIYPTEHKKYIEKITQTGAIITEYEHEEPPLSFHFPQRNRIIAGLSQAVVIVEAPEKSGSLITARLALEYGKYIFAVPCDTDRKIGRGTIRLIQNCGAYPIIHPEEIFEQMGLQIRMPFAPSREALDAPETHPSDLAEKEIIIYKTLSKKRSKTFDEIANETKLRAPEIMSIISILEMRGIVKKSDAGFIKQ